MHPFLRWAADHSLALPAGALIGLIWANLSESTYDILTHVLHFAVNDVGMAFFFALAAKEVVEASAPGGALHPWRNAAPPILAAVGGVAGPALVYTFIVTAIGEPGLARGWAIPCATDIAFSYLVARAIFRDHPAIPFLLLLAIADDAIGLAILAVFYPSGGLRPVAGLTLMAAALAVSFLLRRKRVKGFWPYLLSGGTLSWASLYWGGLHPALALVPIMGFMPHARRDPGLFVEAPASAHDALSEFEHWWKYPVQVVLFFFGAVNAGVPLSDVGPGTWAVLGAIIVGKPLGILAVVTPAVAVGGLRLPARMSWSDLMVVSVAASIGFTVALFFSVVAFPARTPLDEAYLDQTKMGALLSLGSAVVAWGVAAILGVGRFRASVGR
jgi:NhaA family Na+:H+ antiporter